MLYSSGLDPFHYYCIQISYPAKMWMFTAQFYYFVADFLHVSIHASSYIDLPKFIKNKWIYCIFSTFSHDSFIVHIFIVCFCITLTHCETQSYANSYNQNQTNSINITEKWIGNWNETHLSQLILSLCTA